jgi:hypothetical protein
MRSALAIIPLVLLLGAGTAAAAIPVIDKKILTKKSRTQSHTSDTKTSQKKTKKHTEGVDCAVHEGDKKADGSEQRQDPAAEDETFKKFAEPKGPGNVQEGLGDHRANTGNVIEEGGAAREAIRKNQKKFEAFIEEIGRTDTVRGAADQNAVIGTQNGLVMNNMLETANTFVQAYNLLNQLQLLKKSQQAVATTSDGVFTGSPYQCSDGTAGKGTSAKPCVSSYCENLDQYGQFPEGCFASWFMTPKGVAVTDVTHPTEIVYVTGKPVPKPANTPALARFIELQQETQP